MRRRILAAASVSAVLITGLTACSGAERASDDCTTPLQPGMLSNSVELTSLEGGTPSVRITGGTDILNAQRSVLVPAESGAELIRGSEVVSANITVFDAESGAVIDPTQQRFVQALPEDVKQDFADFLASDEANTLNYVELTMASLICSAPGEVLAIGMTADQAYASQLSIQPVVIVAEVLEAGPMRAKGAARTLPWGFPAIASDDTGRPGVVLPPQAAPTEQRVAVAIEGRGSEVTADDILIGHVLTVGWDGTSRDNTWESGPVNLGDEATPSFPFRDALTGHPVGSRVVVLDPNDGDPLVHVVDIIAAG